MVIADGNGDELLLQICDGCDDNSTESIEPIAFFYLSLLSASCS